MLHTVPGLGDAIIGKVIWKSHNLKNDTDTNVDMEIQ